MQELEFPVAQLTAAYLTAHGDDPVKPIDVMLHKPAEQENTPAMDVYNAEWLKAKAEHGASESTS